MPPDRSGDAVGRWQALRYSAHGLPALFPGALLYGVLASLIVQTWWLVTGVLMLRRQAMR
jgi:hypothetical protein